MKNILIYLAAAMLLIKLLFPLLALHSTGKPPTDSTSPTPTQPLTSASDSFRVLDTQSGNISEISAADYVFGVVACEMPATYESQALAAQAVCAYTYALYKKGLGENPNYDISVDTSIDQGFITRERAREKWGDKADEYEQKIDGIVKEVSGQYIAYDGAPILAAYHAISAGKTESAENVWGKALPYLVQVESLGDLLATDYLTETKISAAEFQAKFQEKCSLSGEPSSWVGTAAFSDSGTVLKQQIGGTELSGSEIREILGLRSANFEISLSDLTFTITVRGYGHGVGMSQNGANYMAQQGSTYQEILGWYYTGCVIVNS